MTKAAVPRVAWLSPMPPAESGIASYSAAVLAGLVRTGYRRRRQLDVLWPLRAKHLAAIARYRIGVFHVGNNHVFHGDIYRLAALHPGVVVLHDLALDDLVRALVDQGDALGLRASREAMLRADRLTLPEAEREAPLAQPWCAHLARAARGIVVHSAFCRRYLEDFGCRTPVFVVPHPLVERESDVRRAASTGVRLRAELGVSRRGSEDVLVVAAGDMNPAKLLEAVTAAVARLGPNVHIALVGRRVPTWSPDALVRQGGLGRRLSVHADVTDEEFLGWLHAADVVADLRFPHRGEVSGTLIRAMQVGRPCLVSATGTYLDVPEDAVVRVPAGPVEPAELAAILEGALADGERRRRVGEAARAYVLEHHGGDRTARGYEEAIERTLALVDDPRRLALTRWARALNEIGIGPEGLDEGYGVSYVHALSGLVPGRPEVRR